MEYQAAIDRDFLYNPDKHVCFVINNEFTIVGEGGSHFRSIPQCSMGSWVVASRKHGFGFLANAS